MKMLKYLPILVVSIPAYATNMAIVVNPPAPQPMAAQPAYNWQAYRGFIPKRAFIGGKEANRGLYVCQAPYQGGLHPGKIVAGRCNITYGGREIRMNQFGVLVGNNYSWAPARRGIIPPNAVIGGNENGQPLFVCQAFFAGGYHPGKVVAGSCNIGYAGNEIASTQYQVLVSRSRAYYATPTPPMGPPSEAYYSGMEEGDMQSNASYPQPTVTLSNN